MKKPSLTLDANLVQDDLPLEVAPRIFVGSIHAAFNLEALVSNGITHILNASRLPPTFPKQFTYLSVEIRDKDGSNILSCIPTTNIFIEAGLDHGGVLVHCFGGKSRSPAFIAAYLMSSRNWTFDEAHRVIKTARPPADINIGFEYQLRAYGAAKYDVFVAQQLLLRARIRELHFLRGDATILSSDTNVSDHLNISKLSVANLLGNQAPIQQRLDQITAKNLAQHKNDMVLAQQKDIPPQDEAKFTYTRNKRSFEDVKVILAYEEDNSSMDIDGTDGDDSSFRSPNNKPSMRFSPVDGTMDAKATKTLNLQHPRDANNVDMLEESQDSLLSGASGASTDIGSRPGSGSSVRRQKLPKENYADDVIKSVSSNQSFDRKAIAPIATHTVTFHAGVHESTSTSSNSKAGKSSRHRPNHGSRGSNNSGGIDAKNPSCRLSRPGSTAIRVIPPLRGLEREFKCSWCNTPLFQLASVIRTDLDIMGMLEDFINGLQSCSDRRHFNSASNTEAREDLEEAYLHQAKHQSEHAHYPAGGSGVADQQYVSMAMSPDAMMLSPRTMSAGKRGQILPPISMRGKPSHSNMFGSDSSYDRPTSSHSPAHTSSSVVEMEVDQDYHPFVVPLKTSKAAGRTRSGFNFDGDSSPPKDMSIPLPAVRRHSSNTHSSSTSPDYPYPRVTTPRTLPALDFTPNTSSSNMMGSALMAAPSPRLEPMLLSSTSMPMMVQHEDFRVLALASNSSGLGSSSGLGMAEIDKKKLTPTKSFFAPLFPGLNPPHHGKTCVDISPRVTIPPHRQLYVPQHTSSNSSTVLYCRPASAEKRRWLARVSLLREGDQKVVQLAEMDDVVASELAHSEEKYFYLEYLDWMGKDIFVPNKDYNDLCCTGCKRVVGCCNWAPSLRLLRNGQIEAPLFLIHKNVVYHTDADFDATPSGTPRLPDDYSHN